MILRMETTIVPTTLLMFYMQVELISIKREDYNGILTTRRGLE